MTAITTKSTKAEILAAYRDLEAITENQTITADQLKNTATTVWTELVALIQDTYRLGCWCRKGYDRVLDELKACC